MAEYRLFKKGFSTMYLDERKSGLLGMGKWKYITSSTYWSTLLVEFKDHLENYDIIAAGDAATMLAFLEDKTKNNPQGLSD